MLIFCQLHRRMNSPQPNSSVCLNIQDPEESFLMFAQLSHNCHMISVLLLRPAIKYDWGINLLAGRPICMVALSATVRSSLKKMLFEAA